MVQRRWSLETARELLPEVRRRTERAVAEAERLDAERNAQPPVRWPKRGETLVLCAIERRAVSATAVISAASCSINLACGD